MVTKPPWLDPYHVPQYWMIFSLLKSIHVRRWQLGVYTSFFTQCPFTCVTNILREKKWDLVCHIQMLLASYHPCMANFVWIIYPMGDIVVKDQCGLFNVFFHNVLHNFIFYERMFFHFSRVHVLQPLLWVSTLTNQSVNLKTPLVPKRTNVSWCMVRLNWCLCVLVWMWHSSKPHHPEIYDKI
jgi:hypothetical protein